jgi:hypothetical protein
MNFICKENNFANLGQVPVENIWTVACDRSLMARDLYQIIAE